MKNECSIIRDLLPLYAENLASPETVEFVEAHLKTCDACRKEYERMKEPKTSGPTADQVKTSTAPLLKLRQKMRTKKIQTVAVTALLVIALLVSAFSVLTAHDYLPYSEDLITVTENADKTVNVTFNDNVTNYHLEFYSDPKGGEQKYCHISAWSTLWDKWFSGGKAEPFTTNLAKTPFAIYYDSNNGQEDVCIYGEPLDPNGGITSLPHLTLGYYFIIAAILFALLLAVRVIFRKKENIKVWIERIILYPVSYAIAHLIVVGFSFATYSTTRDLPLIVFISFLLWCGLLLAHSILRNRKEIKEISRALDE